MVEYDPFSDEVMDAPYPVYARLREESPVHHLEKYDSYALSRFEDIWTASEDAVNYSVAKGTSAPQLLSRVLPIFANLNHMDPPDQTQLRKQIAGFFTPRAVLSWEEQLRSFLRERLAQILPLGRCDVVGDLAFPVSAKIACIAVGFPAEDSDALVGIVQRFFRREEGVVGMTEDGMAAFAEMQDYFMDLIRERTRAGVEADNPVNALLTARRYGAERPSLETRAEHLTLLLIGSTETFPKTFASALLRLGQHPDQRAEVVADPSLIPDAFDEVLRYDMPTQFLMRTLVNDVTLHGVTMRSGRPVAFLYPAANRDPHEFDQPDTFDIHRRPRRILTFGHGVHRCLGVHFAKLEGRVLLEEVLAVMPNYRVDEASAVREKTEFVQGFTSLPVEFNPS